MNPLEAEKDKRIEELELALATEQQARWAAEQDREHWREQCEDLVNAVLIAFKHEPDAVVTAMAEASRKGLINEKGEAVEQ